MEIQESKKTLEKPQGTGYVDVPILSEKPNKAKLICSGPNPIMLGDHMDGKAREDHVIAPTGSDNEVEQWGFYRINK